MIGRTVQLLAAAGCGALVGASAMKLLKGVQSSSGVAPPVQRALNSTIKPPPSWTGSRRLVVITGGARGVGAHLVLRFLAAGCSVATCDVLPVDEHTKAQWTEAQGGSGRLYVAQCDVTNEAGVKEFVANTAKHFPDERWACLINNAALANPYMPGAPSAEEAAANGTMPLASIDMAKFEQFLKINVTGALIMAKHSAEHLQPRRLPANDGTFDERDEDCFGGAIVNISSTRAVMSEPNSEGYAASKGAIESLTHAIAVSNPRIRCNAIRLGWANVAIGFEPSADDHRFHPAGRVGRAEDVYQACAFLANNDRSGFITGETLALDGGVTRKMIYPE